MLSLVALGILVMGGVAIYKAQPAKESQRTQLIRIGQAAVRSSLAEGLQAAFAGEEETTVDPMQDGKTMISGWVDLITKVGRQDRQNYSVVVYKDPYAGWVGERVTVIPQM